MAEGAEIRLVRCPKCEKLLPELPDFSIYQCGGCGAVLKAKQKEVLQDEPNHVLNAPAVTGQEVAKESNSIVEAPPVQMDSSDSFKPDTLDEARKRVTSKNSQNLVRNRNVPINGGPSVYGSEHVHFPIETSRPRPVTHQRAVGPSWGAHGYFDEGQSSYGTGSSYYGRGEKMGPGMSGQMRDLENDRAELMRKLDELKDQISRSCGIFEESKQPQDVGPAYFNNPPEYAPYTADRYGSRPFDPYPERRHPHEPMHYSGSYKPEIPPYGPYSQHHPYHEPGYYGYVNNRDLMLYRHAHGHENFFHQPTSYDKCWPGPHRPLGDNTAGGSNLLSLGPQKPPCVNPKDVDSESDGLHYQRPRKFAAGHKSGRASRPVLGGAPFVGCANCFEVLKIPSRHVLSGESQQKLKCGSCSSIIVFELGDKGMIASDSVPAHREPIQMDENSSGTLNENVRYLNGALNASSNEYDYFHGPCSPKNQKNPKSLAPEKQLDRVSSDSSLSTDHSVENDPRALTQVKSSPNQDSSRSPNGRSKNGSSEQEKVSLERVGSQQKSTKDGGMATEMDVSNEFLNSYISQDSAEISKEAKTRTNNRGGESFFAGLIKKGFKRPNNQCGESGNPQVFVNGRFILDRVVKKAERLAGPIQPGEYWYDKRAGFWGVMGHPCLGIIMPNIEEFDYPMPHHCAAGNTGVYVNGRELHQKDLDLLSSRGLPVARNRSYLVEINGRVIDEQTGEELDGLGKLAPTVERAKHGFGMKVPRFISQLKN